MSTLNTINLKNPSSASNNVVLGSTGGVSIASTVSVGTTIYTPSINDGPIAGSRNRIINGDMRIDQRNNGASVTTTPGYAVDRFLHDFTSTNSTASLQRVLDAPVGFTSSLKYTVTSAASPLANSSSIVQRIEGFNISDLNFGTANAKPITLSFYVKSSLTGSFGGSITNGDHNRTYPFPYTINSANTWEYKTVTIPGDTTGTWLTVNDSGMQVIFSLGAASAREATANVWGSTIARQPTGSVNLISTLNATWQITGVQLEAGTVATPFERRSYGQELTLCQRYYQISTVIANSYLGQYTSGFDAFFGHPMSWITEMRASPTATYQYQGSIQYWVVIGVQPYSSNTSANISIEASKNSWKMSQTRTSGGSAPTSGGIYVFEAGFNVLASAEF